jgi:hypothetical protein
VIDSFRISASEVAPEDTVFLEVIAHDDDGDSLYIIWSATGGHFTDIKTPATSWIAPANIPPGTQYILLVTIHDTKDTLKVGHNIAIGLRPNHIPVIDSISISAEEIPAGQSISARVHASDADGEALSYRWSARGGTFSEPLAALTFWTSPPAAEAGELFDISVKVFDSADSVSATRTIKIIPAVNAAPVVESVTLSQQTAIPGGQITLSAVASDADGDSLTYHWRSASGRLTTPAQAQTNWILPLDAQPGSEPEVALTVSDGKDSTSVLHKVTIVEPPNNPPVIEKIIFSKMEVTPGGTLKLSALAADKDGDSLFYRWNSESGTLLSPDQPLTDWEFPLTVEVGTTADISLTVSDGQDSASVSQQVTVEAGITLSGHAYYWGTKITLSGVDVNLLNLSATTGADGFYQIEFVPGAGEYELRAIKSGFDDYTAQISVSEGKTKFDLAMKSDTETSILSGEIQTIDEIKLGGMKITLLNPDLSVSALSATSARDGSYQVAFIPPGERSFYVENINNASQSLPDTFELDIKQTAQSFNPRIKIYREAYREIAPTNEKNWLRVDCNVQQDSYQLLGSAGSLKMINLISIPADAEKLSYGFYKIIHSVDFQFCSYGMFNESGEGDSFSFALGNKTKEWTIQTMDGDQRFPGHDVYLQFWTSGESSQFSIFEIYLAYFW